MKRRFLFDAHKMPAEQFEKAGDGRKTKHKSARRRALFLELASHGNAEGKSVYPSNKTLARKLGWSAPTVERFMADLKTLGWVENHGKSRYQGTMMRTLNLEPVPSHSLSAMPLDTSPTPSNSQPTASDTHATQSDSRAMPSDKPPLPSANDGQSAQDYLPKDNCLRASEQKPSASSSDCDDEGAIAELVKLFLTNTEGRSFGVGGQNRINLHTSIRRHGLKRVQDALERQIDYSDVDWDDIHCPAEFFLSKLDGLLVELDAMAAASIRVGVNPADLRAAGLVKRDGVWDRPE